MRLKKEVKYWIVYLFLCFTSGASYCIFGPTIGDLRKFCNVDEVSMGYIFAVRTAGDFIGCLLCGPLVDLCHYFSQRTKSEQRKSKLQWLVLSIHKILGIGSFCIILGIGLVPLFPILMGQLFCAFLTGFGDGFVITVVSICLMTTGGGRFGPSLIQAMWFLYSLGMSVNPLFMSIVFKFNLSTRLNLFIIFGSTCALQILGTIGVVLMKSPQREGKKPEIKNENISKEQSQERSEKKQHLVKKKILGVIKKIPVLRILFIFSGLCIQLFHTAFDGSVAFLGPSYGSKVGLDKSTSSLIPTVYNLGILIGRIVGTFEVLYVPSGFIVIQDMLCGCVAFSIYMVFPSSYVAIWLCTFFMGLFASSIVASLFAFPEERFGIVLGGTDTALYFLGGSVGYVSPSVVNVLINAWGKEMYVFLSFLLWNFHCLMYVVHYFIGIAIFYVRKKKETMIK